MSRQLRREDYTVGWVCALPIELAAAKAMLDERHDDLDRDADDNDGNLYCLGMVSGHNVAIGCLPAGHTGNNSAATVATQMQARFKGIRFGLMVGIGGGVPSAEADIRLGDVVVSQPHQKFGGVVQYDFGKTTPSGFERTGSLNSPPQILLSAVSTVRANHLLGESKLSKHISEIERIPTFHRRRAGPDVLFVVDYNHEGGQTCDKCNPERQQARSERESEEQIVAHYGTIASGNQVIKSAIERDKISDDLGGVFCFEMEAAGLMNNFPCLVIRGICDYADSHKNNRWQAYAAGAAAAYAKEVLSVIPAAKVAETLRLEDATLVASAQCSSRLRPTDTDAQNEHDCGLLASPPAKRRKIDSSEDPERRHADRQTFTLATRPVTNSTALLSSQEQECLKSLSFPEQEHRHDDIYTAKNTCEWLPEDPQYRAWTESPRGLFWVKGNPGTGKSVLMKYAVKNMQENQPEALVLSFFIHGQGTGLQKTPLGIFRAILNTILPNFPGYLGQLTTKFEDREKRFGGYMADRWKWTDKELQEFLFDILTKGTQHQAVTIFIDALDECGEVPAKHLLAYFKDLAKKSEHEEAQVRICFSSRHYPILGLDSIPTILVEEQNGKDIEWYARERLKDTYSELKCKQIESEILLKAQGGFQWVFLVTEMVIKGNLNGFRAEKLQEELASCPETLHELYEAIMNGVDMAEKRQMVKLFQWVLFAERPLSAQELRDALATDKDISYNSILELRSHDCWSDTLVGFERYVKYISRGLVQFQTREIWEQYELDGEDSDREAQLIHQSVADYLLERFLSNAGDRPYVSWSEKGAGHFQISRSSLRYLTLKELLESSHLPRGTLSSKFPLAPYAVQFLFKHIRKVEQEGIPQHDLLLTIQWAPQSETIHKIANLWGKLDPDSAHAPQGWPFVGATAFHVLAALGSTSAFNLLLEQDDEDADNEDLHRNSPLMLAIREGHQDIALTLIDRSKPRLRQREETSDQSTTKYKYEKYENKCLVNVNARNNDGDTALTIALGEKAEEVVFKLIEAGADLEYMGHQTALVFYAISSRNMILLDILVEKNVNLDGAVFFALKGCSSKEDHSLKDLISKLLKSGANTRRSVEYDNNPDFEYYEEDQDENEGIYDYDALISASRIGVTGTVDLLLSHGAPATLRNEIGDIPLIVATANGHKDVVESLLRNAPSTVEIEDKDGNSALDVATGLEQLELVKLIIGMGSFSTSSPILKRNFMTAAEAGFADLAEIMLRKDTTIIDSNDNGGGQALLCAAVDGHDVLATLLLQTGKVDVNVKDNTGRTPLSHAVQLGHEMVVKLLLQTDRVDVNSRCLGGLTPISYAAMSGDDGVVELLLRTGTVDANTKDNEGRTPLFYAAGNGNEAVVKIFLQTDKVDADSKDIEGWTPLCVAISKGHEAVVKLLLQTDRVDVNSRCLGCLTPISYAAMRGDDGVVELLLQTGEVDANITDDKGRTPLSHAIENGHETVVKMLLWAGKVDVDIKDKNGRTPLFWAVRSECDTLVTMLLQTGMVDVNLKDDAGEAPLSYAVRNGHEAVVKLLLQTTGVDANIKDKEGQTPLSLAARFGHDAVVKLLLQISGVDADIKDIDGWTPLCWAARFGEEAVVTLLLHTGKIDVNIETVKGRTPLSYAARYGHEAVVKLLLQTTGVDANIKDNEGRTPLCWAVENGHDVVVELLLQVGKADANMREYGGRTPLSYAAEHGHVAVVNLLLRTAEADVNITDIEGWTPLIWAAHNGHEAVVTLLLQTDKVDVNIETVKGRTPLSHAAQNGNETTVRLLLQTSRIDADSKDNGGKTALCWAAQNGNDAVVELLLNTGKVDADARSQDGSTPLSYAAENGREKVAKRLLQTGNVDADSATFYGSTPLLYAAAKGHEAVVKLLLDTGSVDVDKKDDEFQTPLSWSAINGHETVVNLLLRTTKVNPDTKDNERRTPLLWAAINGHEAVVKHLLTVEKIDLEAKDNNGRTPLWWASHNGHAAAVKLLLDTGRVDIETKNNDGRTPLWWAVYNGHEAVVKLLLDTGDVKDETTDNDGQALLCWAAQNGHDTVVKLLLQNHKVDSDAQDVIGSTALSYAAARGHKGVVKLLLQMGKVDPNIKDSWGRTPLSWALSNRHEPVAKLLQAALHG